MRAKKCKREHNGQMTMFLLFVSVILGLILYYCYTKSVDMYETEAERQERLRRERMAGAQK
jgi:hypothetical protein